MNRIVYHKPGKGWANQDVTKSRTDRFYLTQREAYDKAREQISKNGGGEVIVNRRDNGQIRDKNTIPPGNDPVSSKG